MEGNFKRFIVLLLRAAINAFNCPALKYCIAKVFDGTKAILMKAIESLFGLRFTDFDDEDAIRDLKRFESICISFNILPNGFAQDESITPSKWTETKSLLYSSLMAINIFHLILLSVFNLPENLSLILGDFFYGHRSRKYFWPYLLNLTIFGEVLRHYWLYLYKTGGPFSFHMHNFVFDKGYKPEALFMSFFYCHKYRFVSNNLANLWIRIIKMSGIVIGPVLIIIVQSASQLPKTPQQYIFTYFWLLISYFGIVCTLTNLMLTGSIIIIDLSYFYFRAAHVSQTMQNLVTGKIVLQRSEFLTYYETIIRDIILFLNETEYRNHKVRNWLIFLYLGISFSADFGYYSAAIVHIDHGSVDFVIILFSGLSLFAIGICTYVNGIILTMMLSCGKNILKANKYLPSEVKSLIKFTDLQSRLSRTDIAFTIGEIFDMTTWVFVIYLIENATLIMMLTINVK
uniref:Gustatory receptor n=1 Tax=Tetranychus urticae TaxID=32264 RepID=T1K282_TETUR